MTQGFVLAGGQSRRFGEDKLLYPLGGKRLIEYAVKALSDLCDKIYIVTKNPEKFSFLQGVDFLQDLLDKQSALSGLYTALKHLGKGRGLVVAGDMPMLQKSLLCKLLENSAPPLTLFRIGGRLQPMPGVYYSEILMQVEAYMASGGEKLTDLVESLPRKEIEEETAREWDHHLLSFININTKQDLKDILEKHGGKEF